MTDLLKNPDTDEYAGPAPFKANQPKCRDWAMKQTFCFRPDGGGSGTVRWVVPKQDGNDVRQSWNEPFLGSPVMDYTTANKVHLNIEAGLNGFEALLAQVDSKEVSVGWLEENQCPPEFIPSLHDFTKAHLQDAIDDLRRNGAKIPLDAVEKVFESSLPEKKKKAPAKKKAAAS